MANYIQLYKNKIEMLGSDGIMCIDGRWSISTIINKVHERNEKFSEYKKCTSFGIYANKIGSKITKTIEI
jgi:hypothetical protein